MHLIVSWICLELGYVYVFSAKVNRVKTIKKLYHLTNYLSALTASLVDISQYSVQIDILSREKSVLSID